MKIFWVFQFKVLQIWLFAENLSLSPTSRETYVEKQNDKLKSTLQSGTQFERKLAAS